jgi:hypothetical protein
MAAPVGETPRQTLSPEEWNRTERPFDGPRPIPFSALVRIGRDRQLEIRFLPAAPGEPALGRVEVSRPGEPRPYQTIVVAGPGDSAELLRGSRLEDANFDGYADLLLARGGGPPRPYAFYLFDPKTGTFLENDLAREMSERLRGDQLEFQRITGGITLRQQAAICQTGFVWLERFVVDGDRLVKVEEQRHLKTSAGCFAVQSRRGPAEQLEEISRYPVPELDATAN